MRLSALVPLPAKLFLWERFTRLKRKMVGNHVEALLANGRNGRLLIDLEDQNVGRKLSFAGEYGWDEVERLRGYVTPASDVLFVGSHVGAIVVPIAKSCRSVVAVEANPRTFRLLQLNVVLNDCMNVEPINCAASDKEEELQFLMNRVNPGGSKRMPKVHKYMYFSDSPDVITVKGSRLDDVLAGRSFDVIFMDIEGSEYFRLRRHAQAAGRRSRLVYGVCTPSSEERQRRVGGATARPHRTLFLQPLHSHQKPQPDQRAVSAGAAGDVRQRAARRRHRFHALAINFPVLGCFENLP